MSWWPSSEWLEDASKYIWGKRDDGSGKVNNIGLYWIELGMISVLIWLVYVVIFVLWWERISWYNAGWPIIPLYQRWLWTSDFSSWMCAGILGLWCPLGFLHKYLGLHVCQQSPLKLSCEHLGYIYILYLFLLFQLSHTGFLSASRISHSLLI